MSGPHEIDFEHTNYFKICLVDKRLILNTQISLRYVWSYEIDFNIQIALKYIWSIRD